uniref:Uncharacterized protein n=1 Tax=Brassica oleracea var. oleracea TaxID=109376 RepID=A0A0D3DIH1_BRAOL
MGVSLKRRRRFSLACASKRLALSTAANMCMKLPSDASDYVMGAVPLLTNLLQYHDSKMNYATTAWSLKLRLFFPLPIQDVGKHLSGLILLLPTCASGSPLGSRTLLLLGISSILKDILLGSAVSAYASVSPALSRPADQIFEIVNLANELLPPLPQGVISLPTAGTNTLVKAIWIGSSSSFSAGNFCCICYKK